MSGKLKQFPLLLWFVCIASTLISGQDIDKEIASSLDEEIPVTPTQSLLDNLQKSEVVEMRLITDLDQLLANKNKANYQPATCIFKAANGEEITQEIKIRPRGKTRRRICGFPPIKLKFKKSKLATAGFKPYKSLKLVTHCSNEKDADQNVLKEYLAYKMYNELSDFGFRVQLVKINYVDSQNSDNTTRHYGFLIESSKEFEVRHEMESVENFGMGFSDFERNQAEVFSLFQYMIGNTDWLLMTRHNVKFFQKEADAPVVVVPYDFDYSGLINTKYAKANPDYQQKNVRHRLFIGGAEDLSQNTIQHFKNKESELKILIEDSTLLPKKQKKDMLRYIASFYKTLENPQKIERVNPPNSNPSK